MKKIMLTIMLLIIVTIQCFAQDIQGNYDGIVNPYVGDTRESVSMGGFLLQNGEYELSISGGARFEREIPNHLLDRGWYVETGSYAVLREGYFSYLNLQSRSGYQYKKRLGMLFHPRRLFLFDGNDLFFASDEVLRFMGTNPKIVTVTSSSFLAEQGIKYDGYNFRRAERYYLRPWVEAAPGDGIGEWIELTMEKVLLPLDFFLISNGYVSFTNQSLYEKNNRVKKLRIECKEEGIDFSVELLDTPQFQEIRLPKSLPHERMVFRFTIEEVYKGSQWDDTCINMIIPLGNLPWEGY